MGAFHATGQGVEMSMEKAVEYYKKASELGHGKASAILGVMYKKGSGLTQDDKLAEKYFQKSENQGYDLIPLLSAQGIER
ncbi:hypothetical protein GF362_04065 [Candidatus Dojkabacteria bacterium]|nr:hypothetical protein [Candidatus Dojkabacteria bacterium]